MTPTDPTVSVVIPAYNRAATIRAAAESVLRQTWTDFELLIIDDCSTDSTFEEAKALDDPRIRLLRNARNRGAGGTRNAGIAAARGRWIAFQDSDDEWLPRKLEKQMARLLAPGANLPAAYCGMLVIGTIRDRLDGAGGRPAIRYIPRPEIASVEGDLLPTLIRGNVVSTQTLVVRRDVIQALGGFDESFRALEDRELAIRLAQAGPIACVDEPLVLQRFSPNSLTRDLALQAEAKTRMVEKHLETMRRYPDQLAGFYYSIAYDHRLAGNVPAARAMLARARAIRPFEPRFWLMEARLLVPPRGARPGQKAGRPRRR
ncbi:MAG TPA: glycosyltransferase family 2 protein [Gemmatimonadales bacterium]|nr:glycosyltransferase family 2 protein [Gemmatimonadales bacterium]